MFDRERFIEECRAALKEKNAQAAVRELVTRAVSDPAQVVRALGEPKRSGVETIYKADDLTILNLCWGPRMVFKPHDHRMWAVIGIYGGREENFFFRRAETGLTRHGMKELNTKDVTPWASRSSTRSRIRWTRSPLRFTSMAVTSSPHPAANGNPIPSRKFRTTSKPRCAPSRKRTSVSAQSPLALE
jgi:hypothetical protein